MGPERSSAYARRVGAERGKLDGRREDVCLAPGCAQRFAGNFAHRSARKAFHEHNLVRHFEIGERAGAEILELAGGDFAARDDERLDGFIAAGSGDADDMGVGHGGMIQQARLDFSGRDFVAGDVDHRFLSAEEEHVPGLVHGADVARPNAAVCKSGRARFGCVEIVIGIGRASHGDFTRDSRLNRLA